MIYPLVRELAADGIPVVGDLPGCWENQPVATEEGSRKGQTDG
jgi:hypothetical protein